MLLMPNGLQPKKTETLTAAQMNWLAMGEDVCRKLNLTLACPNCLAAGIRQGAVLRGNNDSADSTLSVTCDCRRLVFHTRGA